MWARQKMIKRLDVLLLEQQKPQDLDAILERQHDLERLNHLIEISLDPTTRPAKIEPAPIADPTVILPKIVEPMAPKERTRAERTRNVSGSQVLNQRDIPTDPVRRRPSFGRTSPPLNKTTPAHRSTSSIIEIQSFVPKLDPSGYRGAVKRTKVQVTPRLGRWARTWRKFKALIVKPRRRYLNKGEVLNQLAAGARFELIE